MLVFVTKLPLAVVIKFPYYYFIVCVPILLILEVICIFDCATNAPLLSTVEQPDGLTKSLDSE